MMNSKIKFESTEAYANFEEIVNKIEGNLAYYDYDVAKDMADIIMMTIKTAYESGYESGFANGSFLTLDQVERIQKKHQDSLFTALKYKE